MEHLVVSSGLLVISPGPYFCFASVNALSTAIRSVLSLYSAFWSVPAFFFGLPRVGLLTGTLFTLHQIQVIFSGILVVIECQNHLVDFAKNIICQALSELYKKRWHERGGGHLVSRSPIKYWKYGFSMSSSTNSLSEKLSCFWIRREPGAIRSGFAGISVLLGKSCAYFSSMASHGMVLAFLTQRFSGFIFKPTD